MGLSRFTVFSGNRIERLSEQLAAVLKTPAGAPLQPEIVIVQSKGMERWLSMEIARHLGVCANIRFLFPNALIGNLFTTLIQAPEASPFEPEAMAWRIMNLLPGCMDAPAFASIRSYLDGPMTALKRYQLSARIAGVFDQYLMFRPHMIAGWEKGEDGQWQAALWQSLAGGTSSPHKAKLAGQLFDALSKRSELAARLPERICIFGVSSLPGLHMNVFSALAKHIDVYLFLMNPCREFWGDIPSKKEIKKISRTAMARQEDLDHLHLNQGNPLLSSMGTLARDFFNRVMEEEGAEDAPLFIEPGEDTLLHCIQSDVLGLRDRSGDKTPTPLSTSDRSVRFHACHSPMREAEALQDQLLDMFEQNPDLLPKDVIVMTPDIESYAPYIQAVFDMPAEDDRRIPFSIADRSALSESKTADAFMAILDLWGGRFTSADVTAILERPGVYQRFDLDEADMDLIRQWITDARIRWGIDDGARHNMGLPPIRENTWAAGLDRLFLGYAMSGQDERMFDGILPYDMIEGNNALVLGKFTEFLHRLFNCAQDLGSPRPLNQWAETLKDMLDGFFCADEARDRDARLIRSVLDRMADMGVQAGFDEPTDIHVIKCHLRDHLQKQGFGYGFLTGGVTFCAMLPMRSIPFKVVCLIGMNADAYPRRSAPLGFDLMARQPQPGDPSRRNDDRYLFLEAVLSARQTLYIGYVGQSIQDNTLLPPSALVSELADYIDRGFSMEGSAPVFERLLTRHPLQAFSLKYFRKYGVAPAGAGSLFSYSRDHFRAAKAGLSERKPQEQFIPEALPEPGGEWRRPDLTMLIRFFKHPAKFLLNQRLRLYLEEKESLLEETEPFNLEGLEKYRLEQRLLDKKIRTKNIRALAGVQKSSGLLPHGATGDILYEDITRGVEVFFEKLGPYIGAAPVGPVSVDLNIAECHLTGRLDTVYPDGQVHYRYAKVTPGDRLQTWICHLVLNLSRETDPSGAAPDRSILIGLDPGSGKASAWQYLPVNDARSHLATLVEIFWEGLTRPVHFFPKASWTYAEQSLAKNKSEAEALAAADLTWRGGYHRAGEKENPYFNICFNDANPLDPEFEKLSMAIFNPLIDHEGQA